MKKTPSLYDRVQASLVRRREAIERWKQNPLCAPELVVVRCRDCGRRIRPIGGWQAIHLANGEPPVLLELRDEHEPERWSCTQCGKCPKCGYWIGVVGGCQCEETRATA